MMRSGTAHHRTARTVRLGSVFACLLLASPLVCAGEAGEALARRVYDRPGGNDQAGRGLMSLQQPGQPERVRRLFTYSRQNEQDDSWSLIRFTQPADIKDTGLLSISLANGEEDQWVYLPALKRSRRIPSNRKGGRFVGSDFYYEDLQDRKPGNDRHRILGKESLQGTPTLVLESVPLDASSSVYRKRISWIHEGILLPVRTDYFEEGLEKPTKRYQLYRVQQIQGYWTVLDSVMIDLRTSHQTRLVTEVVKYDQGIPEDFFSARSLENPRSEQRYQP